MVSSHLKKGKIEDSSEDELHLVDAVLAALVKEKRGRVND